MSTSSTQSPFKLIVFFIFFAFAGIGVVMFAMYQSSGNGSNIGDVNVWGTIPESQINTFITNYGSTNDSIQYLKYTYIDSEMFDSTLVEALASGYGPDLVLLSDEQIMHNRDRMYVTPYEMYDARTFKSQFIQSAQSLMLPEGIIGIPVAVDPLVLYWNRTLLAINQYPVPPKDWSELFKMSKKITRKTESGTIELSTIALGETSNVLHFKDIFIAMLQQAGGSVVSFENNKYVSNISNRSSRGTSPAQDALRFYTEFSNPIKSTYTWNKARPMDRDAFIHGELAMYIGYASELPLILEQNPNLNFDVTQLPHLSNGDGENLTTFARVYALAIPRVANNPYGGGQMLNMITTTDASKLFSESIGLPSPQNALLATVPEDALKTTFRNSAIVSRNWLDPNPEATTKIISKMINDVVTGRQHMSQAIERADRELAVLLGNNF